MTEQLNKILSEAIGENKNEKICLIEDIFKVGRQLWAFQPDQHPRWIHDQSKVFDELYEMSIEDLEIFLAQRCADMSFIARELAGFASDEHTTKP